MKSPDNLMRTSRKLWNALTMKLHFAAEPIAWRQLPVVPQFNVSPEGFVPVLATNWMFLDWVSSGASGYNFWSMALPDEDRISSRYDPNHPLFQGWICVYMIRNLIPGQDALFGYDDSGQPQPDKLLRVLAQDHKAWLDMMGVESAPVYSRGGTNMGEAKLGDTSTVWHRGSIVTLADVGYSNPDSFQVSHRSPNTRPPHIPPESFLPERYKWEGLIEPYAPIEYEVHGFPIPLPEHRLTAYFFYSAPSYVLEGKQVNTFETVKSAAAPVLEHGISFVPLHGGF